MIPKNLHFVHFGSLDAPSERCRKTALKHHQDWEIFYWNENNIADLGLDYNALMSDCQNFASLSNIVRLHALDKFGGVYLDSDVEVLKPFDTLLDLSAFCALQDKIMFEKDVGRVCNAILGASAGHPWIRWQIENEDALKTQDAAFGVYIATRAPREGVTILPTEFFYPFLHDSPAHERLAHQDSYAIHHWSGSWLPKK